MPFCVTTNSSEVWKVCYSNYLHKSNRMVATQFLHQYPQTASMTLIWMLLWWVMSTHFIFLFVA